MLNVKCESCTYWSPPRSREAAGNSYGFQNDVDPMVRVGQCRRFPPFMVRTEKGPRAHWPMTLETHWCGEHAEVARPDTDDQV